MAWFDGQLVILLSVSVAWNVSRLLHELMEATVTHASSGTTLYNDILGDLK